MIFILITIVTILYLHISTVITVSNNRRVIHNFEIVDDCHHHNNQRHQNQKPVKVNLISPLSVTQIVTIE